MKKKLFILFLVCAMVFSLIGCGTKYGTYQVAKPGGVHDNDWGEGYFTVIKSWGGVGVKQYMIVYANDTKVLYFIDACITGGMTPLYNQDGTLQIYDE